MEDGNGDGEKLGWNVAGDANTSTIVSNKGLNRYAPFLLVSFCLYGFHDAIAMAQAKDSE